MEQNNWYHYMRQHSEQEKYYLRQKKTRVHGLNLEASLPVIVNIEVA